MNIELIAIITIFLGAAYLIYTNLSIAFYMMLFLSVLLHKELFSFYLWDLMPIRAFAFAFLCVYAFKFAVLVFHPSRFTKLFKELFLNPQVLPLFAFWLIAGLSLYFTKNVRASIFLFGFLTTSLVIFAVFYDNTKKNAELSFKYLKFYIFLVFGLTLFGYFQYFLYSTTGRIVGAFWNIPGNIPRVGSLFWDVNHFAALVGVLLPVSSVLVLTEKTKKHKILYAVVSISLLATLLLTNSRTAWIIDFVAFIVFAILFLLKKYGTKGILILILPLILVSSGLTYEYSRKDSPFRAKVKQYFHYRLDSFDSHMLLLRGSIEIWEEYPILGGGYGGFFEHFSSTKTAATFFGRDPAAFNTRVPAHTIWGELLSGTGVLGFAAFLVFIFVLIFTHIYSAWHTKLWQDFLLNLAMGSAVVGWMVGGVFYSYNSEFYWIVLSLFAAYGFTSLVKLNTNYSAVLNFVYTAKKLHGIFIAILAAVLIFWSLGSNALIPWDEAIYAKISKNIFNSGNFIDLTWKNSAIWYEKPPLYMWMSALLMHLIGNSSLAVRLPSAILGLLTVVLVYKTATKHFGRLVGYISSLALLTTTHFLYYSRIGMTDVSTTFFITAAFAVYMDRFRSSGDKTAISEKNSIYRTILIGIFLGFATLTKGVIGLLPFGIIFLSDLLIARKISIKHYLILLISWSAIALPWHILMYVKYGQQFLSNYIGYHVFDRALSAIEDKGNPFWWYAVVLKVSMRIWFIPLVLSWLLFFNSKIRNDRRFLFILLWFSIFFVFFSAAQSKLTWYIMPVYPAVSILAGLTTVYIMRKVLAAIKMDEKLKYSGAILGITIFALSYLSLNSKLVYTSDLTGAQAHLMTLKESKFGTKGILYLDRVELPLALYYLDGPFEIIDFSSTKKERVPNVSVDERLYLLTKKGRFSESVAGYSYGPTVVEESGDWILWFFEPKADLKKM